MNRNYCSPVSEAVITLSIQRGPQGFVLLEGEWVDNAKGGRSFVAAGEPLDSDKNSRRLAERAFQEHGAGAVRHDYDLRLETGR